MADVTGPCDMDHTGFNAASALVLEAMFTAVRTDHEASESGDDGVLPDRFT